MHRWMQCVWCVLVTAQQLLHRSEEKGKASSASLLSSPLNKQKKKNNLNLLLKAVSMLAGCCDNWRTHSSHSQTRSRGLLSPKLMQLSAISSFSPSFFFSPSPTSFPTLLVKNSPPQTPCWHPILLWDADNEQAYEVRTMAASLGCQGTAEYSRRGEIMAIKIQFM